MKIIDANIVLRYLLHDHEELSTQAAMIIENEHVFIPNEIITEIVYVLVDTLLYAQAVVNKHEIYTFDKKLKKQIEKTLR